MKLTINKTILANALSTCLPATGSQIQIANNVLFSVGANNTAIKCTNLDLSIECMIPVTCENAGESTVNASRLASVVNELPDGDVQISVNDKNVWRVSSGGACFNLNGISADEFPRIEKYQDESKFSIDSGALKTAIDSVECAQSADKTRSVLNGVLFGLSGGKIKLVATDGRRLHLCSREFAESGFDAQKIIPTFAIKAIKPSLANAGTVGVGFDENHVRFTMGGKSGMSVEIMSKLVDGTYPNFDQIINFSAGSKIQMSRALISAIVKRAALVTSEKRNGIILTLSKNKVTISAESEERGSFSESCDVKYKGDEIKLCVDPGYFSDAMKALPFDEFALEIKDELSPLRLSADDKCLAVVMPMRLP